MSLNQFLVRPAGDLLNPVGVVKDCAEIPNAPHARVETGGRLARFKPREAEDALLRFARGPVEIHLLVRACRHARAPAPAAFLIEQDNAVFAALVKSAGRARRHAGGIQTMIADAREVKVHEAFDGGELRLLVRSQPFEVRIVLGIYGSAAEVRS